MIEEESFIDIIKRIWVQRWLILFITLLAILIGGVSFYIADDKYTANIKIMPLDQESGNSMQGMGGLAAMAGINLSSKSMMQISPKVYPEIIKSIPFKLKLCKEKFKLTQTSDSITLFDYVNNRNNKITKKSDSYLGIDRLTLDYEHIYNLDSRIKNVFNYIDDGLSIKFDEKVNLISISATTSNPKISTFIVNKTKRFLQDYIINLKIKKAKDKYNFILKNLNIKEVEFKKLQKDYNRIIDENINLNTAVSQIKIDNIKLKFDFVKSIYIDLGKQLEQVKIEIIQDTPVFSTIQPIEMPQNRSNLSLKLIIIISLLFGFMISIGFIILHPIFRKILFEIKQ